MTWREIVDDAFFDAIQGSPAQLECRLRLDLISRRTAALFDRITTPSSLELLAPSDRGVTGAKPLGTEPGDCPRVLTDAEWRAQQLAELIA